VAKGYQQFVLLDVPFSMAPFRLAQKLRFLFFVSSLGACSSMLSPTARQGGTIPSSVGLDMLKTDDLMLMQHSRRDMAVDSEGREFFTIAGVPMYPHGTQDHQCEWIIVLKSSATSEDCLRIAEAAGGEEHGALMGHPDLGEIPFVRVSLCPGDLQPLVERESNVVDYVEADLPSEVPEPSGDRFGSPQPRQAESRQTWALYRIGADSAPVSGAGVHVYVLDTGVLTTHQQFGGRAIPALEILGSVNECDPCDSTCATDRHGHGTHCAGTVAGKDYGVAPQAMIHSVKVLRDDSRGLVSWSVVANMWILTNALRPTVVSMSLGGHGNSMTSKAAIDDLVANGVTVVVAAGNQAHDACLKSHAFVPNAITVGATDVIDNLAFYSNYGTCVDILAPGSLIDSAGVASNTEIISKDGTSMACPHVSGAAAILLSMNPKMPPSEVIRELKEKAEKNAISGISGAKRGTPNLLLKVDKLSGATARLHGDATERKLLERQADGGTEVQQKLDEGLERKGPDPTPRPTFFPTPLPTAYPTPPPVQIVCGQSLTNRPTPLPTAVPTPVPTPVPLPGLAAMTEPVAAGAIALAVSNVLGFTAGEKIVISGGGNSEENEIAGFGSINLVHPTVHAYPPGTTVSSLSLWPSLTGNVAAIGDPHLRNVYGEAFDLMQPGMHLLVRIPRSAAADRLLQINARAQRFGLGCTDIYFQELNVTGAWAEAKQTGGFRFRAGDVGSEESKWIRFEKVDVKVVHGHTLHGIKYLNFYIKHLEHTGFDIGGLLGEDDHNTESTPDRNCKSTLALMQMPGRSPPSLPVHAKK